MYNISHISPDWGMQDYYRQQDAHAAREAWQEARDDHLRAVYSDACQRIAHSTALAFGLENGTDYYRQYGLDADLNSWHEWLHQAAAEHSSDTAEAMALLISEDAAYATLDYVTAIMQEHLAQAA